MSLEAIKNSIHQGRTYQMISLCGDHGDPIYHTQFHEVLRLLQTIKGDPYDPGIMLATNGSHRNEEWWKKTGSLLKRKDKVIFGVDGLRDTNHLHRRGSDWDSIMLAMETLRKHSQVRVQWQWILFNHNQHQIKDGMKLAQDLGLDRFFVVESARYNQGMEPTISIEEALAAAVP